MAQCGCGAALPYGTHAPGCDLYTHTPAAYPQHDGTRLLTTPERVYSTVFRALLESELSLVCPAPGCDAHLMGNDPVMPAECFDHWLERLAHAASFTNCDPMDHYNGTCDCWSG